MRELHSQPSDQSPGQGTDAGEAVSLVSQLQAELNELRKQLAWSNRLSQLGVVTATLAHELKNQLTPIRSYAQLALANPEDPQLNQRALSSAITASGKANSLINRVLELASPEQSVGASTCQITEAAENAFNCMLPTAKQFGVHLISRVEPGVAAIDALSLEQVLVNLISNACQAMSKQKGNRQVVLQTSESNGYLKIVVSDNGPGIPETIREKIFEPFVSLNRPTQGADREGTGLGLSICKQLITAAGGQIALSESSEVGSTFQIVLPKQAT